MATLGDDTAKVIAPYRHIDLVLLWFPNAVPGTGHDAGMPEDFPQKGCAFVPSDAIEGEYPVVRMASSRHLWTHYADIANRVIWGVPAQDIARELGITHQAVYKAIRMLPDYVKHHYRVPQFWPRCVVCGMPVSTRRSRYCTVHYAERKNEVLQKNVREGEQSDHTKPRRKRTEATIGGVKVTPKDFLD